MVWHTLKEAITLTGRSRRSLYRDMSEGRVSYGLDPAGNRRLDTSELIRAYGALESVAQPGTQVMAHVGTTEPLDRVIAELQALREEVQTLRACLLRLEHKPDPHTASATPSVPDQPTTWSSLIDALGD